MFLSTQNGIDSNHVHSSTESIRRTRKETPLHIATGLGRLQNMEALLDHGADPNTPDHTGDTPLIAACRAGNAPAVRLLLSRGADAGVLDRGGETAVHVVAASGHLMCMKVGAKWVRGFKSGF